MVMADIESRSCRRANHGVQHMRVDGAVAKPSLFMPLEVDLWVVLMVSTSSKFGEATRAGDMAPGILAPL